MLAAIFSKQAKREQFRFRYRSPLIKEGAGTKRQEANVRKNKSQIITIPGMWSRSRSHLRLLRLRIPVI